MGRKAFWASGGPRIPTNTHLSRLVHQDPSQMAACGCISYGLRFPLRWVVALAEGGPWNPKKLSLAQPPGGIGFYHWIARICTRWLIHVPLQVVGVSLLVRSLVSTAWVRRFAEVPQLPACSPGPLSRLPGRSISTLHTHPK